MKNKYWAFLGSLLFVCGCQVSTQKNSNIQYTKKMSEKQENSTTDTAVIAGGCFWCLDAVYRQMEGVILVESGYANGKIKNPTYREVCSGLTGHAEVVKIVFDPKKTSYADLLTVFWRIHDPTTLNRQGNDVGTQYRSGIYYINETQKEIALKSRDAAQEAGLWEGGFVTEIVPLEQYYPAEAYHQDYFTENPEQPYCRFVVGEKVAKFKKLFADKLKK